MISVATGPGLTAFTLIFREESSSEAIFMTAFNAALLAAYTEALGGEIHAEVDDNKTTDALSFSNGMNISSSCTAAS